MTVVVDIDVNKIKRYASINSLNFSQPSDFEKADKLDELIKKRINKYVKQAGLSEIKRDRVLYYWEIGNIIRDIYFNSNLVLKEEKELYLKNVRLHLDKEIFPDNDPSRNRNIPEQFFRLSGFSKEVVEKVKWTIWSYLFDSPLLSNIKNFDLWFIKKLSKENLIFDQGFSRLWFQSINVLFKKINTSDWPDEIILNSIDVLFELCCKVVESGYKLDEKKVMELLKKVVSEKKKEFILFKSGSLSKEEYLKTLFTEFQKKYNDE